MTDARTNAEVPDAVVPDPKAGALAELPVTVAMLQQLSDADLRRVAERWDGLDQHERRALLTVAYSRTGRSQVNVPVVRQQTRRFGYRITRSDGATMVVQGEERIVSHRRAPAPGAQDMPASEAPFGVGFERREEPDAQPAQQPTLAPAPAPSAPKHSAHRPVAAPPVSPQLRPASTDKPAQAAKPAL